MSTETGKRVVVTGATGNAGTSVVAALAADPGVSSVLGLARRRPAWSPPKTEWAAVDLRRETDLVEHFQGADAVIHLAWAFRPTHDPRATWRTNVLGSLQVFRDVAAAGVPALIHASSVGAYSPGPKSGENAVAESWPTHGASGASYCREKAYLERVLDTFELRHPGVRVVRMRPAFLFKEEAASEQRRIFGGRFLPGPLVRPGLLPAVPDIPGLRFQALHTDDAARAYALAATQDVSGAFNLAADPPLDAHRLAGLLGARVVRVPRPAVRAALVAGWTLGLVPASPQLFDAVLRLPLMDCTRARVELGWRPEHSSLDAVGELLRGVRRGSGMETEPLAGHKAS
ncbi:NAD-dependent epimerase/dehydratase family protein [Streptomyces sp. LP05-1]|uniref:NAD-dependent epimerase/dehydratase family protein n=1 Tax=Streptomyces pyxinae TaxID=2970734 RepID=A0ABT2CH54_9ACTN|nr:NAD-dependent epimerase/dehydratase family protein [Streptomyces sp. LP05-1]MCS0636734.1 NAD-dependent epimerase/dehydratase family protein [Streptomyces sp. LP05-1]